MRSCVGLAIGTRDYYNVAVRIAKPHLSVVRSGDPMSGRRGIRVDEVGMRFLVLGMKLQKQIPGAKQPIIYLAMAACCR